MTTSFPTISNPHFRIHEEILPRMGGGNALKFEFGILRILLRSCRFCLVFECRASNESRTASKWKVPEASKVVLVTLSRFESEWFFLHFLILLCGVLCLLCSLVFSLDVYCVVEPFCSWLLIFRWKKEVKSSIAGTKPKRKFEREHIFYVFGNDYIFFLLGRRLVLRFFPEEHVFSFLHRNTSYPF